MNSRAPAAVRDATDGDIPAIQTVAAASWRVTYRDIYPSEFVDDFLARWYSEESLTGAVLRARETREHHFLVAERDGAVVGYLNFGPGEHGPTLYRLYAHPDHFGTGVGHALLGELESRLWSAGTDRYVLSVHERNERGRRFYERQGFVEIGRADDSGDEVMLEKRLSPRASGDAG